MEIRFHVTGSKRKELVAIISEVIGQKQIYKGMPSAAYEVKNITISKDGTVSYDEQTEESTIQAILKKAEAAGFTAEAGDTATAQTESTITEASTDAAEANIVAAASSTGLVISFPADKLNLENLKKLLDSKATLIKRALEVEALPIEEHDD